MAYGMCSGEKHVYELKDERKCEVLLRDSGGIAACLRGGDVAIYQALTIWIGVFLLPQWMPVWECSIVTRVVLLLFLLFIVEGYSR